MWYFLLLLPLMVFLGIKFFGRFTGTFTSTHSSNKAYLISRVKMRLIKPEKPTRVNFRIATVGVLRNRYGNVFFGYQHGLRSKEQTTFYWRLDTLAPHPVMIIEKVHDGYTVEIGRIKPVGSLYSGCLVIQQLGPKYCHLYLETELGRSPQQKFIVDGKEAFFYPIVKPESPVCINKHARTTLTLWVD